MDPLIRIAQVARIDRALDPASRQRDERMRQASDAVRAAAQAQGLVEGRQQGHRDGWASGHAEGHAAGLTQGLAEGRAQGEREGLASARAQAEAAASEQWRAAQAALGQALSEAQRAQRAPLDDALALAHTIAIEALTRVLGQALVTQAGLQGLIDQALADCRGLRVVRVRLSPDDLTRLTTPANPGDAPWLPPEGSRLQADPTLANGDCVIDLADPAQPAPAAHATPAQTLGSLDARLHTQWQALCDALGRARAAAAADQP